MSNENICESRQRIVWEEADRRIWAIGGKVLSFVIAEHGWRPGSFASLDLAIAAFALDDGYLQALQDKAIELDSDRLIRSLKLEEIGVPVPLKCSFADP